MVRAQFLIPVAQYESPWCYVVYPLTARERSADQLSDAYFTLCRRAAMRLPHHPPASAQWRPASTCAAVLLAGALSTTPLLQQPAVALEPGTSTLLAAQYKCAISKDKNGAPIAKDCVMLVDDKGDVVDEAAMAAARPGAAPAKTAPPAPPAPAPSPAPE